MHMADALISPAVGGTLWAVTAGTITYCSRKVAQDNDDRKVALMGVLGAFIFAAQMINFAIPGTGSSGHLGGGMVLAILLGPHAAFLVMASVLTVQALFFADGGLLALGCNIFNLAFFPCFVAYPFIYRIIVGSRPGERRIFIGAILSAIVGLQFGALAVVVETVISGITELPLTTFAYLMQPIHLAIGVVEGFVTAGVVLFISKARPEILHLSSNNNPSNALGYRKLLAVLLAAAIVSGGALSWFASDQPDGLEWTIEGITRSEEIVQHESRIHEGLAWIQETVSIFPDYGFKNTPDEAELPEGWPAVKKETSFAGLAGGALTLFVTGIIGFLLKRRRSIA